MGNAFKLWGSGCNFLEHRDPSGPRLLEWTALRFFLLLGSSEFQQAGLQW